MTEREALKLALEALEIEESQTAYPGRWLTNAITAIREALAQPEQEPVIDRSAAVRIATSLGWEPKRKLKLAEHEHAIYCRGVEDGKAQRKPLTDEQIEDIWADCPADWDDKINVLTLARAIEAAHGIKE